MPYIHADRITHLANGGVVESPGELTFVIQSAIAEYLTNRGPLSYSGIAAVLGALEGAKLDFNERVVQPYEQKKAQENGDVWPRSLAPLPSPHETGD